HALHAHRPGHPDHDCRATGRVGVGPVTPDGNICEDAFREGTPGRQSAQYTQHRPHQPVLDWNRVERTGYGHHLGDRQSCERCRGTGGSKPEPHVRMRAGSWFVLMSMVVKVGGALLENAEKAVEEVQRVAKGRSVVVNG